MFQMVLNIERDRIYKYALTALKHNYYIKYQLKINHPTVDELLDESDINLINQNNIRIKMTQTTSKIEAWFEDKNILLTFMLHLKK